MNKGTLTVEGAITLKDGEAPSSPNLEGIKIYTKSDEKIYKLSKANIEEELLTQSSAVIESLSLKSFDINNNAAKYVSPAGSNANNGQIDRPYQTITYALTNLNAGGVVNLESGNYNENVVLNNNDVRKFIKGTGEIGKIISRTVIAGQILIEEQCRQNSISNITLSYSNASNPPIKITSTSTELNLNLHNISVSANVQHPFVLEVENGGGGYIDLNNVDFGNKGINLKDSTVPRFCYISNSRNITINAGLNWFVVDCGNNDFNILEASSNNNVIVNTNVNGLIETLTDYSLIESTPGKYLANIAIPSIPADAGDVFIITSIGGSVARYVEKKHYSALPTYYNLALQKSYYKSNNLWQEVGSGGGAGGELTPIGTIAAYYGNNIPQGWLLCDGSTFDEVEYDTLNSFLGSNVLPDLRGYFLRGLDTTGTIDPNGVGRTVGSVQGDIFKTHRHGTKITRSEKGTSVGVSFEGHYALLHRMDSSFTDTAPQTTDDPTAADSRGGDNKDVNTRYYNTSYGEAGYNLDENANADDHGLETRPKNIAVNYIIKAKHYPASAYNILAGNNVSIVTDEVSKTATINVEKNKPLHLPKFSSIEHSATYSHFFIYNKRLYASGSPYNFLTRGTDEIFVPIQQNIIDSNGNIVDIKDVVYTTNAIIVLSEDGRVFEWGVYVTPNFIPIELPFPAGVIIDKIYAPRSSINFTLEQTSFYALSTDGQLFGWRNNSWGQLGRGDNVYKNIPTLIEGAISGKIITKVSISYSNGIHVAAIDSTGQLYTWGYEGGTGCLGTGAFIANRNTPYLVPGIDDAVDVIAMGCWDGGTSVNATRVLRADGTSWAAGSNHYGQLGIGSTTNQNVFVQESTLSEDIRKIFRVENQSSSSNAIVKSDGKLYFVGRNFDYSFGNGVDINSANTQFINTAQLDNAPFQGNMLENGNGIIPKVITTGSVEAPGFNNTIVLDNTGSIYVVGINEYATLGLPESDLFLTSFRKVTPHPTLKVIDFISVGHDPSFNKGFILILENGVMMATGQNVNGALGFTSSPGRAMGYLPELIGFGSTNFI